MSKKHICVLTTNSRLAEPRAPRHAEWLTRLSGVRVTLIDAMPRSKDIQDKISDHSPYDTRTIYFHTRETSRLERAKDVISGTINRVFDFAIGKSSAGSHWGQSKQAKKILGELKPDLILAESIEALMVAAEYSNISGCKIAFDSMEYFADMGEGQSKKSMLLIDKLQSTLLPRCVFVLTASKEIEEELIRQYKIRATVVLRNVPEVQQIRSEKKNKGLALYWRNAVLGLSQRGLDDALQALVGLPEDVSLFLQGRPAADGGQQLKNRIKELGLCERVKILPPCKPNMAVESASVYDIGLCLERKTCLNHELTTSNKIYDYHMAGLCILASELRGLSAVLAESKGGLTFKPGDHFDLREKISALHSDPIKLNRMKVSARRYAEESANRNAEFEKFKVALKESTETEQ